MKGTAALLTVAMGTMGPHAAPSKVQEGYLKAGEGVYLFYRKIGHGKHVVIIPLRQFLFEPLSKLAAKDRTLIFYDVRNRGSSTPVADGNQISIQHDVEDVEMVRARFGVQRFTLVGFSYAGLMVAMYAMEHPERIERLIQLGPVPLKYPTKYANEFMPDDTERVPDPVDMAKLQELRKQGLEQSEPKEYCEREWAVQRFQLVGDPTHVDRLGKGPCGMPNEWPINLERHFKYHFVSVQRLSIDPKKIAAIKQPVLIIHGTKDRNAYYGAGREWSMMLPHGLLLTVKGAAHCSWADAPDVVIPAIDGFLRGKASHFFMPTPN
jgi:pimeloyl-ACP methyl ester carboxylesterase